MKTEHPKEGQLFRVIQRLHDPIYALLLDDTGLRGSVSAELQLNEAVVFLAMGLPSDGTGGMAHVMSSHGPGWVWFHRIVPVEDAPAL